MHGGSLPRRPELEDSVKVLADAMKKASDQTAAAAQASKIAFANEPVDGVGSEQWKAMFQRRKDLLHRGPPTPAKSSRSLAKVVIASSATSLSTRTQGQTHSIR